MKLRNSALVVVDVQKGFVTDETRHVLPAVVELVKRWQARGRQSCLFALFQLSGVGV